jgi:hypothetical protein
LATIDSVEPSLATSVVPSTIQKKILSESQLLGLMPALTSPST